MLGDPIHGRDGVADRPFSLPVEHLQGDDRDARRHAGELRLELACPRHDAGDVRAMSVLVAPKPWGPVREIDEPEDPRVLQVGMGVLRDARIDERDCHAGPAITVLLGEEVGLD